MANVAELVPEMLRIPGLLRQDCTKALEPHRLRGVQGYAHICTSLVWSLRIRTITIGISTGTADITAATPSAGFAASKA